MRIASIARSNTEILCGLGCGNEIVACTSYDTKRLPGASVVGAYVDIDVQKVVSLGPDIVFTSTFLQEKYKKEFESSGLEVLHFDPVSVDGIIRDIIAVGTAVGKTAEARVIVAGMKAQIKEVGKLVEGLPAMKVYAEEWPRPPMAAGNWVVQMLELAGGTGLLANGERSREVSLDELLSFSPEKIVLNWCGVGKNAKPSVVAERKGWNALESVANHRIFVLDDSNFNTPSQNVVLGIRELAAVLHGV